MIQKKKKRENKGTKVTAVPSAPLYSCPSYQGGA